MAEVFGARLRQARIAAGWSLRELAQRVHYSVAYLSRVENGHRAPTVALARRCDHELATGDTLAGLVRPAPPAAARNRARPVPRQLPANTPYFVGRGADLARLDAVRAKPRDSTTIIAITGTAGVGKSTLALHWAHRIQGDFPDGQLHLSLRGFGPQPPLESGQALHGVLGDLGLATEAIPAELAARAALYRSLLADRRMLVVLDNARDAEQVRPLLPGGPGCVVLITSRDRLDGLVAKEGGHRVPLELFTVEQGRALLAERVGPGVAAPPGTVAELVRLCAGLPLALSVVAARAADSPGCARLVEELRDARGRLDALDLGAGEEDLRAVFSWSYQQLGPAAARLFRLLGGHPGPDIGVHAAAALAGVPFAKARKAIAELVRANLLAEHWPGRFRAHDLLRVYAAELPDPEGERNPGLHRVFEHYLHTARAAAELLHPHWAEVTLPEPGPHAQPRELADYPQAMRWFDEERLVLLACVHQARDQNWHSDTWRLAWAMAKFLQLRGFWPDWVATQRLALEAADRLGDRAAQAVAHRLLGHAFLRLRRYAESIKHAEAAGERYRELGDPAGQAYVHRTLAWVHQEQQDFPRAVTHHRQALALYRQTGFRPGQASSLNGLGWTSAHLGEHERAFELCGQALAVATEIGDRNTEAAVHDSLGFIHHRLGEHTEATANYHRAITIFDQLSNRHEAALSLHRLGDTQLAAGDPLAAGESWRSSLSFLDSRRHPQAEEVRGKLAGLRSR
ncbi:tetratricopeptide repeat protein [Crossiella sp. SN42]|uniref:ATP-binding protein n=1 Tax=Crossiella sp. SN42 TaxID=2944808 RepID=UPI00207D5598|nr:tetratricopeptide repeat protein [Crossiella sp. SN42]MCO1577229.1 tetratricopeptide repeat protein [Crossiella sp. SN42]